MKHVFRFIILSLFLLAQAHAESRYTVEMIFFAQDDDKAFFSENWPLDTGLNGLKDASEEDKIGKFEELPSSELTMAGAAEALNKSPRYLSLIHI